MKDIVVCDCDRYSPFGSDLGGPEKGRGFLSMLRPSGDLAAEAVEGATLAFQSVDDVHGRDRLALSVLGVGDGVADDVLQEDLEYASGLLVDKAGDALDAASASQATDGGLGDALDVVTKHLTVTLGASLPETFASLAASRHSRYVNLLCWERRKRMTPLGPVRLSNHCADLRELRTPTATDQ